MDRNSQLSKFSQEENGSSGSDDWTETPSRPPSEYSYSRPNYPYPKLRKQQNQNPQNPPPKAAYQRQPQEWAQHSLSDLQLETPPATPGMGTPLRSLTPSAVWLPEYPNSSFSQSPVVGVLPVRRVDMALLTRLLPTEKPNLDSSVIPQCPLHIFYA